MLAKEVKIKNFKRQREFIKEQLENRQENLREDGDTAYRYIGHIFPEVIGYFESEGFDIKKNESELLLASTKGLPVYTFTIRDDVVLNEEELKAAEEIEYKPDEESPQTPEFEAMMAGFFGGH